MLAFPGSGVKVLAWESKLAGAIGTVPQPTRAALENASSARCRKYLIASIVLLRCLRLRPRLSFVTSQVSQRATLVSNELAKNSAWMYGK